MSYLNAGISKLTERIYRALVEAKETRQRLHTVERMYVPGHERIQEVRNTMRQQTAHAAGLVEAWEIVTGEIWGEAAWQPTGSRS